MRIKYYFKYIEEKKIQIKKKSKRTRETNVLNEGLNLTYFDMMMIFLQREQNADSIRILCY